MSGRDDGILPLAGDMMCVFRVVAAVMSTPLCGTRVPEGGDSDDVMYRHSVM